jgi:hypothetical protein
MGQSSCSPVRSPYLAGDQLFLLRPEHHRAPAEDELALLGFSYGLDIVLLVGQLRLKMTSDPIGIAKKDK